MGPDPAAALARGGAGLSEPTALPRGAVVFLTGLSGAGKSTIAAAVADRLRERHPEREVAILDGDELRRHVSSDLGFDAASRSANVERAARIAAQLANEGAIVVAAVIAPFDVARRSARAIVSAVATFRLVWVQAPLAVAEARDVKGLYARARRGELADFTGISSPYEEPLDADLVVDTSTLSVEACADAVLALLEGALAAD
jgi:sulfate adenylyltransferase